MGTKYKFCCVKIYPTAQSRSVQDGVNGLMYVLLIRSFLID